MYYSQESLELMNIAYNNSIIQFDDQSFDSESLVVVVV